MQQDIYGQLIFDESDLCNLYLVNPNISLDNVLIKENIKFDKQLDLNNVPNCKVYVDPKISIEEFDNINQNNWHFPEEYKNMDIAKYVLDQCKTEEELQRAGQELLLFQERGMFTLLKYLKYLVDTMRKNNIVWGVGRGSSVSSFVLFLLEIHKINSLYYGLEIDEFIR